MNFREFLDNFSWSRLTSPFYKSFLIAWCFWNRNFLYLLILEDWKLILENKWLLKYELLETYSVFSLNNLAYGLLYPLISVICFYYFLSYLELFVRWIANRYKIKQINADSILKWKKIDASMLEVDNELKEMQKKNELLELKRVNELKEKDNEINKLKKDMQLKEMKDTTSDLDSDRDLLNYIEDEEFYEVFNSERKNDIFNELKDLYKNQDMIFTKIHLKEEFERKNLYDFKGKKITSKWIRFLKLYYNEINKIDELPF